MNQLDRLDRPKPMTTRDAVYAYLKEAIIKLELLPGASLSENEVAAKLSVSRTPVRESFVRLEQEGLVHVLPQRGTFVSLIDPELAEEGRFMREMLERAVIRLACSHFPDAALERLEQNLKEQSECIKQQSYVTMYELDEAFHEIIFTGCRKSMTWASIQQMNSHLNRSRMLRLVDNHDWLHLYNQHNQMTLAIRAKHAELAEQLMKEHMNLNVADQALLKEKYPKYYKS